MKASLVFLACLMSTAVVPGQTTNCLSPPAGLVSWWRAEANALDSKGTNHGTAPRTTNYAPGKVGQAFTGIVYVQDSPSLRFTNALTIEAWVNPSRVDAGLQTIISKLGARVPLLGLNVSNSYYLGISAGRLYFSISTNGLDRLNALLRSVNTVPNNEWTHVAATFGAGTMRLYINGREDAKASVAGMIFPSDAQLGIGGVPYPNGDLIPGPSSLFAGRIDELAAYRRELSEFEIQALYRANAAGKCPPTPAGCISPPAGLISWWRAERDTSVGENVVLDNWDSNNGTSVYAMQYSTGKVGQAFNLLKSYVRVPDSTSLRLTNALTIEAWVRPTSVTPTLQTIISKFDYESQARPPVSSGSAYYLGITNGGRLVFKLSAAGSPRTNTTLLSVGRLPANQWAHVAATFGQGSMRLFINGQEDTKTNHAGGVFPGGANVGIGALPVDGQFTYPFSGLMDELAVYNRQLSEFEVQANYNADTAGKCLAVPSITAQPPDQAIPLGEDAKFSVSILGSRPLRYQWRFNGQNLPGATNATLILERVQSNRIGNYSVFVSNSVGTVTSATAALTLLPAPTCTPTPEGLISWWPADGNGADAMGTNNTSFVPAPYVTGKVDRAFSLLGTPQYQVTVPNSPSLNFSSNADFSIEMWIKAGASNTTYANVPLFEKFSGVNLTPSSGYSLSLNQGRLAFTLGAFGGFILQPPVSPPLTFISPGPDLRDAFFHHVAVSLKRNATNGGNLFVDGHLVLTFDPTPRNINLVNAGPLYIGGPAITTTNSYFGGLIDEPAIYSRALSAAEILAIRNAGAAGRCKVRPFIATQPASQRVTIGSNVTFSVVADGTQRLRYQWLRGSANISSATNTSYSFVVSNNSGGPYSVRVTNLFGSVVSSNAVLTVNYVPIAANRQVMLWEDQPTNIVLSAGDQNKAEIVTFAVVTPPQHGSLSPLILMPGDASYFARTTYTPVADYHGPDSFTFNVNDGLVDSAVATITLNILPMNDAPVASSQAVSLDEDKVVAFTLAAFDVEGDVLTFSVNAPAHGTLNGTAPNLVYHPATNYSGPDSFTFSTSDGKTNSNLATVSLTVRPVNDAPLVNFVVSPLATNVPGVTNWVVLAAVCGNAPTVLDGTGSSDVEDDQLSFTWLDRTNVIATGELVTNSLAPGSHEISLQVNDGQATGVTTATVEVISPAQGVGIVIVLLHESELGRRNVQPLIASLKNGAAAFERCDLKPGVNQLEAFKSKVRAQIAPSNPELAAKLIEAIEQVIAAAR